MDMFHAFADDEDDYGRLLGATTTQRDTTIQLIFSAALGLGAFLTFCILRPRWTSLYAARKQQKDAATILPELPETMFGWIPVLWKITDQQVLASAGLDAYVFLDFFKMAMQFLFVTLLFSLVVIKPVHDAYPDKDNNIIHHNDSRNDTKGHHNETRRSVNLLAASNGRNSTIPFLPDDLETDYLWMYVVFAYLFSAIAVYLVVSHTRKVIEVRQEYLGTQTTITDRTIRLSGIPKQLQDEKKIEDFIESLDIGKVESVTICRNWKALDNSMIERLDVLRRLELAYTIHSGRRSIERNLESLPISQPPPPGPAPSEDAEDSADEGSRLMGANGGHSDVPYSRERPKVTMRFGRWKLQNRTVDAIDYYSERLRKLDERIEGLRRKEFETTSLAFVTMDSVASAQMAVQAVLDPSPLQLLADYSPPASEIIWTNTYQPRRSRLLKSWSITTIIVLLTIFWSVLFVPIAGLLNTETISKAFPQLADVLDAHKNIRALVNTQLPTLIASLLTVLVPYLYYYLSWYQGFIAVGEIELSAISKNFFFTFFNFFVIFTVLGTASKFYEIFERFGDAIQDFRNVAYTLAVSLQKLLAFYVNFIILQALGLHPFRLLEFGSVALYPFYRMGAKTPRDYAELVQPPFFTYGYYLPTALLIFIICMVYSVLRQSWTVLLAGFAYFALGHFVYKYQLLYAMDHSPHSTGRAWGMMCDRVFVGMIFFQLTTAGQLLAKQALSRSVLMIPLTIATIWFSIVFGQTYKPLLKFIALRNIKKAQLDEYTAPDDPLPDGLAESERNVWADLDVNQWRYYREARSGVPSNQDLVRYVNPSLVQPLRGVWVANKDFADGIVGNGAEDAV